MGYATDDGNGVTWGRNDMVLAVKNGHSDVVRWVLEHTHNTCRVRDDVYIRAAFAGNLPIVKFLLYRGFPVTEDHYLLVKLAALKGHLALLKWLVKRNFLDGHREVQLSSQHLDVNMWLVEAGLESGVENAFERACGEGPLPVVWWLADYMKTKGIDLDADTAGAAMDGAAGQGRLEVVKWLIERDLGRGNTVAFHFAAMGGHLEVMKYLHAQGFTGCHLGTVQMAVRGGHLSVVQWLWTVFGDGFHFVEDGVRWVRSQMELAACHGHLEVVQYLHTIMLAFAEKRRERGEISQHSSEFEMDDAVTGAARHDEMGIVQWLCANTTVNSFEEAIASAANRGNFAMVKWLHENRPNEMFQEE